MDTRYRTSTGCVYTLKYHIVWCSKFGREVLVGEVASRLKGLLWEKANQMGVGIEAMEIMPDHVHLFVSSDPTEPPQRVVNQLKGYPSRFLRAEFPLLKSRLPSLWPRSYYVGSVGHVSEGTVRKYIEAQKGK